MEFIHFDHHQQYFYPSTKFMLTSCRSMKDHEDLPRVAGWEEDGKAYWYTKGRAKSLYLGHVNNRPHDKVVEPSLCCGGE